MTVFVIQLLKSPEMVILFVYSFIYYCRMYVHDVGMGACIHLVVSLALGYHPSCQKTETKAKKKKTNPPFKKGIGNAC